MPPPVIGEQQRQQQQNQKSGRPHTHSRSSSKGGNRSDLVCRIKYNNSLPDIPFDPKFLAYPFEPNRFVQYNATSLERNHQHELLTETDLGLPIDLIDPDIYEDKRSRDSSDGLHEIDAQLVEDEIVPQPEKKRSRQHAKNVSWLRKTEYISTEYNRFQTSSENPETKVGYNVKKLFLEKDVYKDRESQIEAIEGTFEAAKKPVLKHHSKPGITAKEVLPLFPDFDMWKFPFAQVIFDTDPTVVDRPEKDQSEDMSQAMIRGMVDDEGEQFVGYFLPTVETKKKRKRDAEEGLEYAPGDEYEYRMAREYNWTVKNKLTKGYEENYFLLLRDGEGVFYNELETRVRLSKRRAKKGHVANRSTFLAVKHREMETDELENQEQRLSQLEPPVIEEERREEFVEEAEEHDFSIAAQQKADIADVFGSSGDEDEDQDEERTPNKTAVDVSDVFGDDSSDET